MSIDQTTSTTETKRFVAPSMTRALELVREEMGPEAIILSSQKVSGGVEIITSIERDLPTRGISERRAFGQNFDSEMDQALDSDASWQSQAGIEQAAERYPGTVEANGAETTKRRPMGEDLALEIERARERMLAAKKQASQIDQNSVLENSISENNVLENNVLENNVPKNTASKNTVPQRQALHSEPAHTSKVDVAEAPVQPSVPDVENERKLESLRGELADLRMLLERQVWGRPEVPVAVSHKADSQSKKVLRDHLNRLGLSDYIVNDLLQRTDASDRLSDAWKQALNHLSRSIPIAKNMDTLNGGTYAFVGPTGVGKTTSIAKLAAQYTLEHGSGKVALVSMDTHRVGAVEQLRALGRILNAPVRCVNKENSLMTLLASLRDFPLVLIDTAGFRHGDPKLHHQLSVLDEIQGIKRTLVLSSLSQLQTLKASIHAFSSQQALDACILTKLDETLSLGEALSAVVEHELPLAYITNGQQVPDDISRAKGHDLVANAVSLAKHSDSTNVVSL